MLPPLRSWTGLGKASASSRVVLVQPSVYGTDNRGLLNALAVLGPEVARGVAVIDPETVSDVTLQDLHKAGVRGVRVNLGIQGGAESRIGSQRHLRDG